MTAVIGPDFQILQFNEAFRNCFKVESLQKVKFLDFFSPDEAEKIAKSLNDVFEKNERSSYNLRKYKFSDFTDYCTIFWEFIKITDSDENTILAIGTLSKNKEHIILPENLFMLDAILTTTNESSIILSKENKVEYFSSQAQIDVKQFFGKHIQIGDDFDQYIIPELRDLFYEKFNEAWRGQEIYYEINIPVGPDDGLWYFIKFIPIKSSLGIVSSVMYSARNINDIKRYESELNQQKFYLKSMYESSDSAIAIFDRKIKLVYANKKAYELTEKKFGKKISKGDYAFDFFYPGSHALFQEKIESALHNEPVVFEYNDKDEYWKFKIFPIHDENLNIIGLSIHISDITEIKNYEKKIIEQVQFLKRLAWSQSHELRGPLSTILAISENIHEIQDEDIQELMLDKIKKYAEQMDEIIKSTVLSINQLSEKYKS